MITTKKTKRSISATYQKSNNVAKKGNRIPAVPIAIAEINTELKRSTMCKKQ